VDNQKVGYVTGLDINQAVAIEAVEPIDTVIVEELVVVGMRVNWNAAMVAVANFTAFQKLWFNSLEELVAGGRELQMQVLDTIQTEDNPEGTVLFSLDHVKTGDLTWRVEGRTIATRNVSGQARIAKIETQPDLITDSPPAEP
jgi:hypothetical protein